MSEYYIYAKDFCAWANQLKEITSSNAISIAIEIMKIYTETACLEYPVDVDANAPPFTREFLSVSAGPHDAYWEIFNPYICDEPVCGSLIDDLNDIYNEIKNGIFLYEHGFVSDAVWLWKWSFENHWKHHAADAIRALSSIE